MYNKKLNKEKKLIQQPHYLWDQPLTQLSELSYQGIINQMMPPC